MDRDGAARERDARTARESVGRWINLVGASAAAAYVLWVLLGTVAWISHLGERVETLGRWLPARGYPANAAAGSVWTFAARNVPASAWFVAPHSLMLPSRLRRWFGRYGRLMYNFISAATLHAFLLAFVPLKTPVVMTIPFNAGFHNALSVGCLAYATYAFLASRATWGLLGVSSALGIRDPRYANPASGMDAITWMGVTTWRLGGSFAFVLFTGLSIIPRELTLGDCITRCVAAVYLRLRSRSFREWVEKIENIHLLTWTLRAVLLSFACLSALRAGADVRAVGLILIGAVSLAGILRLAEADAELRRAAPAKPSLGRKLADSATSLADAPATSEDIDKRAPNRPERWRAWNPHEHLS